MNIQELPFPGFGSPSTSQVIKNPMPDRECPSIRNRLINTTAILTPPTSPQAGSSTTVPGFPSKQESLNLPQTPVSPQNPAVRFGLARTESGKSVREDEEISLECPFDVDLVEDGRGQKQVFGYGAWSTVYKATPLAQRGLFTNITTNSTSQTSELPALVAVKKPARKDANVILKNEAKILSYLSTFMTSERYVILFYGVSSDGYSLVLEAVPQSLDDFINKRAIEAGQNFHNSSMENPVIGSVNDWLQLARRLVSALTWLHDTTGVVHGDIKPGNILLSSPNTCPSDLPFEPLFADFSSSQFINAPEPTPNTLSAITREYTAPELLSVSVLINPKSTATTASDVFSMAVTLLVAATGETLVYPGSVFQRQVMATQGWQILNFVRNGPQGLRIPRHGVVEKILERAVLKADMGRIKSSRWLELIAEQMRGEPQKK